MGGKKNAGRNAAETANQFTQMGIDTLDPFLQAGTGQLGALTQGASVGGLDERLRDETQMPCHLAESPLTCVAVGSGRSLEEFEAIHRANRNSRHRRRSN